MRRLKKSIYLVAALTATACTSAKENSEYNAAAPTTIQSDADRRAIYNNGSALNTTAPSSVPRQLNDRSSEINRQKNIENRGENSSNNRPLEVRTRELGRPTTDSLR